MSTPGLSLDAQAVVRAAEQLATHVRRIADALTTPATGPRAAITAALTAEHYRRAEARIVASPEEHCAAMTDAVMTVLPSWIAAGSRDLSIPAHAPAADEDQTLRWARRESLLVLLTRLQRGRTLTEDEARTLREHVEHEMREADTARAVAAGNKRHVQLIVPELGQVQAAIERVRAQAEAQRARGASRSTDHKAGLYDAATAILAVLDGTEQKSTKEG